MRRNWRLLAAFTSIGLVSSPVVLLIPSDRGRMLALGAFVATWIALATHFVVVLSGSTSFMLGDFGEQWTAAELKGLRRRGWQVVHHALLGYGDIDSVLIGPGGVVVVETKAGAIDWADEGQLPRITQAVAQASANAGTVRRFLKPAIGDAPVQPVVALWPAGGVPAREVDAIAVLPGLELRRWVEALPGGALDEARINRAWELLSAQLRRRDAGELTKHGPGPRSMAEYLFGLAKPVIGFLAGTVAVGEFLRAGLGPAAVLMAVTAIGAAWAMRIESLRDVARGFFVGTAGFLAVAAASVVLFVLFR